MGENNDQRFGSYVGFPIACCESQYIAFFQKLERVWEKQVAAVSTQVGNSNKKGMRELRNLVFTIDYDGHSVWNTRGSVKSSV